MSAPIRLARSLLAVSLALAAGTAAAQQAHTFTQTIFFGDSLTDSGFFRPTLTQANPALAQAGKFTTNPGNVWAENVAAYYGTNGAPAWTGKGTPPPTPATGSNYAVGGARLATDGSGSLGYTPSVATQVSAYLARTGGVADPHALYTVWGGANDLRTIATPAQAPAVIGAAVTAEIGIVQSLEGAGARYVLVPNMPDFGLTPESRLGGPAVQAGGTAAAAGFNDALYSNMTAFGLRYIPLDTFHLLREIVGNPSSFGFTNVANTACGPGYAPAGASVTCLPPNYNAANAADVYVFADGIHPSTAAHRIVADYAIATIEGPRQIALLPHVTAMGQQDSARALASQLSFAPQGDGMQWWVSGQGSHFDVSNDEAGVGTSGTPVALNGGIGWTRGEYRYGGALGFARQRMDFGQDRGNFRNNMVSLTGFGGWHGNDGSWASGQIGYARSSYDVHRGVPLGKGMRTHSGSTNGGDFFVDVEGGHMFSHGRLQHGPVAGMLIQRVTVDGYTESDPQLSTALAFPKQTMDSMLASVGYELRYSASDAWTPYARVGYDRELMRGDTEARATMTSLSTPVTYAVPAPGFQRNQGRADLGVRGHIAGLDLQAGASAGFGNGGSKRSSLFLTLGKGF